MDKCVDDITQYQKRENQRSIRETKSGSKILSCARLPEKSIKKRDLVIMPPLCEAGSPMREERLFLPSYLCTDMHSTRYYLDGKYQEDNKQDGS